MSCYRLKLLIASTLMICLAAFAVEAAQLPDDEVQALKDIASALKKTSWDLYVDQCNEMGNGTVSTNDNVTCDCTYENNSVCHITSISWKRQSLQGTLPPDFVRLRYLQNLDLTLNYLDGTIPSQWGSMANIRYIVVEFNQLSGELPEELGNLSRLQRL
ncbi:hypothetical protein CRG98_025326 [Punica granatum]|uniref:Uncharacterized protein n=1 Tax=Punica granatum TaxID=22663 RepID=A0A2I0JF19_PUNGR|nr:hypothetical protein CRG98_025326 [Punica granatum]